MHAVARSGPIVGLVLLLLAPFGSVRAVTAVVGEAAPEVSFPVLSSADRYPRADHASRHTVSQDSLRLADYRGKVVYLDFWSAWCAPCRQAMPRLDVLRQAFPREQFEVVGVNVDAVAADARRFLQQVSVSYPVVADVGGVIAGRFGVDVLPALVVIDAAGVVRETVVGGKADTDMLRAKLEVLIEEQEVQ